MLNHNRLLHDVQNPDSLTEPRRTLLGPSPLAHTKHLLQELPTLRQHVGPRPWYDWLERATPPESPR